MSSWADKIRNKNAPPAQQSNINNINYNNNNLANQQNDESTAKGQQQQPKNHNKNNRKKSTLHAGASPILLLTVFHFLSGRELALKAAQVCHSWRNVTHDPGCWNFAWVDHVISIETGFGRECYDPLPQLLRLAGVYYSSAPFSSSSSSRQQNNNNKNKNDSSAAADDGRAHSSDSVNSMPTPLRALVKGSILNTAFPSSLNNNNNVGFCGENHQNQHLPDGSSHHQIDWEKLEARGGPSLLSQREIEYIFKLSSKNNFDNDRYKAIVKSGLYRLRFILSTLMHNHELRRDLNYGESFGHLAFAKNYLRRRFIRNLLQKKKAALRSQQAERDRQQQQQQQQQQQTSSQPTTPAPTLPVSPPLTSATAAPIPVDDEGINATNQETTGAAANANENEEQVQEFDYVFRKLKTKRVRCFTFVDRQQWEEWLGATQIQRVRDQKQQEQENQDELLYDEEEEEYEDEEENENYDDENDENHLVNFDSESGMRPSSLLVSAPPQSERASTVGSLTALETLQTLRSTPSSSVTRLNAHQTLNIFSHVHAGAPLPTSAAVALVDSTECVSAEDDEMLTDIGALMLGEQPYHPVPISEKDQKLFEYELSLRAKRKRKLRLIEINLKLADDIIQMAATRPKERNSASEILADFALRPMSRYFPPKTLDQVDSTMRILNVGRSSTTTTTTTSSSSYNNYNHSNNSGLSVPPAPSNNNNNHQYSSEFRPSFLNAGSSSFDDEAFGNNIDDDNTDDTQEHSHPEEYLGPLGSIADELQLSECLSLLCAPKFFSGPELCGESSVTILAVDPMRLTLVKLRA